MATRRDRRDGDSKGAEPPSASLEHALASALDLLARKERELAEVRRSEESYRSMVEKVMDLVFCIDREGRFTFVNSAVLFILAYRPEELIGQHFTSILSEDSKPVAMAHFQRNLQGKGPRMVYDLEFLSKDERRVPMEVHGTNVYEDGEVAGVRGIARDMSAHLRAEQQQQHRFNQLRAINQVGQQIAGVLSLDDLLPFLVDLLRETFGYHHVNVFLVDDTGEYMVSRASSAGYGQPLPEGTSLKIGEQGIVGWVARTGDPMLVNDVHQEPRYFATAHLRLTQSELVVPVKLGEQIVGVLDLQSDRREAFDEADQWAAQTLADQIAVAIRNAELFEAERTRRQETGLILDITRAVNSTLLLGEVLQVAAAAIARAVGNLSCGIYLLDETGATLMPQTGASGPHSLAVGDLFMATPLDIAPDPFLREVMETRRPVEGVDMETDPRTRKEIVELLHLRSLLAVPFVSRGQVLGMAMVSAFEDRYDFSPEQIELAAGIANSVALAIENARLYERTRELAVMEERNRMAREIHDTIAQGLTGIVLQLEVADQLMDANSEKARMRVEKATTLARNSLQEARRSVWNLRPHPLEERSLPEAIGQELGRLSEECSLVGDLKVDGEVRHLSGETENGLFRIAVEVLNNVRKHARAAHVGVEIRFGDSSVSLKVRDDGVGFDPEAVRPARGDGGGFGLLGLQERVRLLKGSLVVESAPGRGTLVEVEIPLARS